MRNKDKRKQRIKGTQNNSTLYEIETTPPPYEEQQLPLRTTKVKKNFSPPIKIGKTKQVLGKTVFKKNKGGGDKYKGTNQVLKKN